MGTPAEVATLQQGIRKFRALRAEIPSRAEEFVRNGETTMARIKVQQEQARDAARQDESDASEF